MYQAHFGLKKPLFESGIAQDAAVFLAAKHELIIANSKVALTTFDSAVVLTGKAGVGKTTLISSALRTTNTRLALGWLTGNPVNGAELLELLLVELGFNAHRVGRVERMQMWRQFLNEMRATESRVFVIVERADDLSHEVLRALDSLTAADASGSPGANLVLLGQPALLEHLKAPVLESLCQRVRLRERLEPLTADELRAYLAHQVARAGGTFDNVFAPAAVGTLHALSGGVPRIANNLCETALALAAAGKESVLTPGLLTRIAVTMFGIESPAAPGAPAAPTASATAIPPPTPIAPIAPIAPAAASSAPAAPTPSTTAPAAAPARVATPSPRVTAPLRDAITPAVAATFSVPTAVAFEPPGAPTYTPPSRAQSEPGAPPATFNVTPAAAKAPAVATVRPIEAAPPPRSAVANARADAPLLVARPPSAPAARPAEERVARPAARVSFPPVIPSRPSAPAARAEPEPEIDSFADTLTDSPDVQMPDLPVLTDAVETSTRIERRTRAEMAYARQDTAATARAPAAPASKPAPTQYVRSAAPAPSAPPKPAPPVAVKRVAPAAPPKPAAESAEEELEHQTQTVRALAAAKSIDDISNSMAETLFGEADLDMLSAALGAAGWSDDSAAGTTVTAEENAPAAAPKSAAAPPKAPTEEDPFDLFDLGPDAPLELIDDSATPGDPGALNNRALNNR